MIGTIGAAIVLTGIGWQEERPVFSGPQAGESLPKLVATGVYGAQEDKPIEITAKSKDRATLIFFVHEITRPAFGLVKVLTEFANQNEKKLNCAVVFLDEDVTERKAWLKRVRGHFRPPTTYAISPDGIEGPGAYGLNRNITLTVIVANKGKVTNNFALVQPSDAQDGPKIANAVAKQINVKSPDLAKLRTQRQVKTMLSLNPQLAAVLKPMMSKDASSDDVAAARKKVEELAKTDKRIPTKVSGLALSLINSGRASAYSKESRKQLEEWSEFARRRMRARRAPQRRPNARKERESGKDQPEKGDGRS